MKAIMICLLSLPLFAMAETVDVKDVGTSDEDTTIEIHKGKSAKEAAKGDAQWEISEGTSDISGDTGTLTNEAKNNWKKACEDWKKEFRQDNKDNKIISMNCGAPTCTGEAGTKTCTSTAAYKIKAKVN
jgi:hypothetical protein